MTRAKKGASARQTSHGTDRDGPKGNETIEATTAHTPLSAAENTGGQQTDQGVEDDGPTRSEPAETETATRAPLSVASSGTNEGAEDNRSAGGAGADAQTVQPTSATSGPIGTNAELKRPGLAGLSFRKVTPLPPNLSEEGASQDKEDDERKSKRQRTGSVSRIVTPGVGTAADPLLTYEMSPAPSPPPKNAETAIAPLPGIGSTNSFIARLEAKAAKAAEPVPAPPPAPMSDNAELFTPRPDQGFPQVQGRNSTFPFDNISCQQLIDWLKLPGPCVFAQPLMHGYYPPQIAQEIVGMLREVIGDILGHASAKITAPIAASTPVNLDQAPYTYLVRNISSDDVAKLAFRQCWATNRIGFLIYTAEAIMPSYLGAIQGFNMSDDEDIAALLNLVQQTFRDSEILAIIANASKQAIPETDPMKKANDIINTVNIRIIHIRSQRGSLRPIANLYLKWPFDDDEAWSQITAVVARTSYQDSLLGLGTYYAGWTCTICHGADHPSGLCPLPLIPGWIKATPIPPVIDYRNQVRNTNNQAMEQQMRGPSRGRGGGFRGGNWASTNTPRGQRGHARRGGGFV